MSMQLDIFRKVNYDGEIYTKLRSDDINTTINIKSITVKLFRDEKVVKEVSSEEPFALICFEYQPPGTYRAVANITFVRNKQVQTLPSKVIAISSAQKQINVKNEHRSVVDLRGALHLDQSDKNHLLEVKFLPDGLKQLMKEDGSVVPFFTQVKDKLNFHKIFDMVSGNPKKVSVLRGFADFYKNIYNTLKC